ncbi:7692_t:CDS:2, partial [Scutellospora calospora]
FVSTTVLFGERLYYNDTVHTIKNSENNKKTFSATINVHDQEVEWISSLQDFMLWEPIEFRKPLAKFIPPGQITLLALPAKLSISL